MFKAYCASMAAALLAGTAGSAVAQTPAATPAQTQASAKPASDPNEIVCEKQESTTGSRLGAKRVCMTRGQWADRRLQDRQELERVQIQRGAKGE
jgi:hypothetical protein